MSDLNSEISSPNRNSPATTSAKALTLRKAIATDIPLLIELYAAMDGEAPLSLETAARLFDQIEQVPNYSIYLASLNAEIIGTFSLLLAPTFMHRGLHRFALMDAVMVRPESRGLGLGKTMVQTALRISQEQGCYKLMLSSNLQRDRAHQFYQSLGFRQHGWSFSLETNGQLELRCTHK